MRLCASISGCLRPASVAAGLWLCASSSVCLLAVPSTSRLASAAEPPGSARLEPEVLDALAASEDGRAYVIVLLKELYVPASAGWEARRAAIRAQQAAALSGIPGADFEPAYVYRHFAGMTGKVTAAGLARLAASPAVAGVGVDKVVHVAGRSAAGFIGATEVHEALGVTGEGYAVVVLDTGVETSHPDLADDILPGGWTFLDGGATSHPGGEDDMFHGTAVAGVITGAGNVAPLGIAPGAKILPIKFIKADDTGYFSDSMAGFDYAISLKVGGDPQYHGILAINCSFYVEGAQSCPCDDSGSDMRLAARAVQAARDAGIITFAASGNGNHCGAIVAPACLSGAVAVGAAYHEDVGLQSCSGGSCGAGCTDPTTGPDQMSCFTDVSECLGLVGPFFVDSTMLGGQAGLFGGTSAATPHAAAVATLVGEAAGGGLWPDEIVAVLKQTGVRIPGRCGPVGTFPRVDALAAVTASFSAGEDCNSNGVGDALEILQGGVPDCNRNRIPDACELASGSSQDCDGNSIPDECDVDCNHDDIPDACEIADGSVSDCNENGIPDSCDILPGAEEMVESAWAHISSPSIDATLGDLDGDGFPDLLSLSATAATVLVYRNDGSGSQAHLSDYEVGGKGPSRLLAADLDADGKLDAVVTHGGGALTPGKTIGVLRGLGDGTLEAAVTFDTGRQPVDAVSGDLDGDGLPDLVTANGSSKDLTVLLNRTTPGGPIALAAPASYPLGYSPSVVIAVDLDRDGRLDLVAGTWRASGLDVLLGAADGSFQGPSHLDLPVSPMTLASCDIDGDGFPDLVALERDSGNIKILRSHGGTLDAPTEVEILHTTSVVHPSHLVVADVSGDGLPDILVGAANLGLVSYLRSIGGGRLDVPRRTNLGVLVGITFQPTRLALGDVDGDGDLDFGVVSASELWFLSVRNDLAPAHSLDLDSNGIPDECVPPGAVFRRGDTNADAVVDISDAVAILGFLFLGSNARPPCDKGADVNDDGNLDLSDAVALLGHLFLGAPAPPAPFPDCGRDLTDDILDCAGPGPCA